MSKEKPAKLTGNAGSGSSTSSTLAALNNNREQQRQRRQASEQARLLSGTAISNSTQRNDLTPVSETPANGQSLATLDSPNGSPSKSSPSKSRNKNKKKSEAKRRSAELKRQQQQATGPAPSEMHQESEQAPPTPEVASGKEKSPDESDEQKPSDHQSSKEQNKQMDGDEETNESPAARHVEVYAAIELTSQSMESETRGESQDTSNGNHSLSDRNSAEREPSNATSANGNDGSPIAQTRQARRSEPSIDSNSWRRKQKENRDLREQLKAREAQLRELSERAKQQISRTREVEASLAISARTCSQLEKGLQEEFENRRRLLAERDSLNHALAKLKNQVSILEKEKSANNELIRALNATLMERETEVSILKLKMTRIQTNSTSTSHVANMSQLNPPSSSSLAKRDAQEAFTMAGRSNSEFTRNSRVRSTMMAEAASTRSSLSHLQQSNDRDASVWATVPEELTPSKRPLLLERTLPQIYDHQHNTGIYGNESSSPLRGQQSSTPILRDRRYRTLPRSMKNPLQRSEDQTSASSANSDAAKRQQAPLLLTPAKCIVTNLDEGNNTSQSSGNKSSPELKTATSKSGDLSCESKPSFDTSGLPVMPGVPREPDVASTSSAPPPPIKDNSSESSKPSDTPHQLNINNSNTSQEEEPMTLEKTKPPPHLPSRSPSTPVKIPSGLKKIFSKFSKRSGSSFVSPCESSQSRSDLKSSNDPTPTPTTSAFQRGAARSTLVGPPSFLQAQVSPKRAIDFQTEKPFAEWDTDMLVDWLTMIGLSMYANQCRRWVKCGAHIMNATPAEVDKGLGITNHLHRKKLRLAISELNGDCDKITKAASKLDYLWVARWLDDIGLPQHKEAFINARVDGRVLNYLTVEDLVSLGVKSLLHHSSIRCGIRVLRSINFDLQLLKRRATADEIERMNSVRKSIDEQASRTLASNKDSAGASEGQQQVRESHEIDVPLWTCHRVMEWLRMIDFAEFAPNLRGSGVHGGLIMYEDAFNIDTISALLSIPSSRTLLRRHLSTFFGNLIGDELAKRKKQYRDQSSGQQLNPVSEIKTPKKSPLWFGKLKGSKVGQDGMDEYLCPMYPVEPQIVKNPARKSEAATHREPLNLSIIPESINV